MVWDEPDWVLVGETDIYHAPSGIAACRLSRKSNSFRVPTSTQLHGKLCRLFATRDGELTEVHLGPVATPEVKQTLEQALNDDQYFSLRPGSVIDVDTSGLSDQSHAAEVRESLVKLLAENGFEYQAGAKLRLQAWSKMGPSTSGEYEVNNTPFGTFRQSNGPSITVTYTPFITGLRILSDTATLWEASRSTGPGETLNIAPGRTAQEQATEDAKPTYTFFQHCDLPLRLARDGREFLFTESNR